MKKIFAILLSALALGGCENDGIPYVSLGLDDLYKVARMQTVDLKPAFTGESYRWTVKTASGADSLLSEEKDYIFLMQYPGTYDVTFQIFDPVNPIVHRMTFYVVEEEVEYSPYISTVYEYCPAPGQFVNAMPEYREGDTAETMRQKAEEAIAGKRQSGFSRRIRRLHHVRIRPYGRKRSGRIRHPHRRQLVQQRSSSGRRRRQFGTGYHHGHVRREPKRQA